MAETDFRLAFNRGVISKLALARADIQRTALAAETQMNWVPRAMGPMSLRPGLQYIGPTAVTLGRVRHLPFIFANNDTALIELTDALMRVRVDEVLVTRVSVATTVANGGFDTNLTSWADADAGAAVSQWVTGGYMGLKGDGTLAASRTQTLTVAGGDQNVEHALRIVVARGYPILRVGSTAGGDEYIAETTLGVGIHSLAFTPTGASAYIQFNFRDDYEALITSCNAEAAGVMSIASPIASASLDSIRQTQSGDVIFLACKGYRPQKIERRSTRSWSLVDYTPDNGPFRASNVSPLTLVPSALNGDVTITASAPYFKSTNVGSLISIVSTGQTVTKTLGAADVWSDPIRVSGIDASRIFTIIITGTWVATVTLQRSVGVVGSWTDVTTYTTNQSISYDDTWDNQIVYYRIGIKPAEYTSGSASAELRYASGSITGIARAVGFTSGTVVAAVVLKDFGSLVASSDWAESAWSTRRGFPSAVALFGSRLWWGGKDKVWGSVIDDFANFDSEYLGDAGPISRSIGQGPVDNVSWLLPIKALMMGAEGGEFICRSTGLEEPITPANFNLKEETTYGSADVEPVKIDASGIFVDRIGSRVMEVVADATGAATSELTILTPEICLPSIERIAVQRRPDTRVHIVLCNGDVVLLVFDKIEEVKCFTTIETEGLIEDVVVLPGSPEDKVYYTVARIVNGAVVRYLEKWAYVTEATNGLVNKMADSFIVYDGVSTATITGLGHLEGKSVIAWGNTKDLGTYTVSGGSITLSEATTYAVVGLPYNSLFISGKLGNAVRGPDSLNRTRRVDHVGLILRDTHKQGLQYGTDIAHMDELPLVEEGVAVAADTVWEPYDSDPLPVNGTFGFDTRLVLTASAPRACTVAAVVIETQAGGR